MENAQRANRRPDLRTQLDRKLRRASWVNARTGERSQRQFTLREASNRLPQSGDETTPLLPNGHGRHDGASDDPSGYAAVWESVRQPVDQAWSFACSKTGQGIFKCSLAYLIGSFATLILPVSDWFGHRQDSKHMVATVTVYFAPARTVGSMHEATIMAFIASAYAAVLSFTSMGVTTFFGQRDQLVIGHFIVLILFVGGGMGSLAWIKQRLGNPLVTTATSLAVLSCVTILLKEGSVQTGQFSTTRSLEIIIMVLTGIMITTVINGLVFPVFARKKLSNDLERHTDLLGEMLISITRAFLQGREGDLLDEYHKHLSQDHQASLNSLRKNLSEAKKEYLLIGNESYYAVEARLVDCMIGLSQDLGGLRSAAFAQFAFINQAETANGMPKDSQWLSFPTPTSNNDSNQKPLGAISESRSRLVSAYGSPANQDGVSSPSTVPHTPRSVYTESGSELRDQQDALNSTITKGPGDMFVAFVSQLGPPIKSLVYTLKQILDELPFVERPSAWSRWNPWVIRTHEVAVNEQFHYSLREAVDLYRHSRKEALTMLYHNRAIRTAVSAQQRLRPTFGQRNPSVAASPSGTKGLAAKILADRDPEEVLADIEEVSACCGHFSFSLLDFAEDMMTYLNILDELKAEMEGGKHSWKWLLFWRRPGKEAPVLPRAEMNGVANDPDHIVADQVKKAEVLAGPRISSEGKPWYYAIYQALRFLRRDEIRFGVKVGIGAAIYALPAFLQSTRPTFVHWRGEWGLVSYMVVCTFSIGATTAASLQRLIGSCLGGGLAILGWVLANRNGNADPWVLGVFGWLVSLPCFYVIVAKENGPFGRFILLTYNLGALYSFTLSNADNDNDNDEGSIHPAIWDIVLHRLVSVVVGIAWGLIVSRGIWPLSARKKLRGGICILFLRMGLIWKRDPLATLLQGDPQTAYMDISEESELHSYLANLKGLRKGAVSEFELRGPFPDKPFGRILDHAGRMLDAFHAVNVAIRKNLQYTPGEAAVLRYTRTERFALSARISHLFTVLASSIKLQYPLNDVLPNIDNSRDQLLAKISEYRRTNEARELTSEQDYEMVYAYVLVTGQLAQDIQAVGEEIEKLYGKLEDTKLELS